MNRRVFGALATAVCLFGLAMLTPNISAAISQPDQQIAITNQLPTTVLATHTRDSGILAISAHDVGISEHPATIGIECDVGWRTTSATHPQPAALGKMIIGTMDQGVGWVKTPTTPTLMSHHTGVTWHADNATNRPVPAD